MNKRVVSVSFAAMALLWPAAALAVPDSDVAPQPASVSETTIPPAPADAVRIDAAPVESAPVSAAPVDAAPVAAVPVDVAPVVAAPPAATESAAPTQPAPVAGAPAQSAPVAAEDTAVADKLRDLIENKLAQHVTHAKDRAGVRAFYQGRGFAPLWVGHGAALPRAKDAIAFLQGVAADGLDPADYPTPAFGSSDPQQLAADELKLTSAVLAFARHAATGRVAFTRVSGAVYFDLKFPEPSQVLGQTAASNDVRATLGAFNPQHPAYKALKTALATARQQTSAPDAMPLKPAGKHKHETRRDRTDAIIANMERWRWMPHDLGGDYVMVNIPNYTLRVAHDGKTVWTTKIVVGKVGGHATPLLTETMKYITVNPTWNVPPSIIRNEYLPALARDPNALARVGLHIGRNSDGSIRIYQPPGERNALGRIRFNFPNRFLVYQHDTPDKNLFAHDTRAYSHGCMRVQNPDEYAQVLLSIAQPEDGYTAKKIRSMYGSGERNITFKKQIPVYITYQTAFVDDAGKLETRDDLYGLDREITKLRREDRKIADVPVARNYSSGGKPVAAHLPRSRANRFAAGAAAPQPESSQSFGWNGDNGWGGSSQRYDRFRPW
jgi:murein L,D-transpeptidase YcbB/YkuD